MTTFPILLASAESNRITWRIVMLSEIAKLSPKAQSSLAEAMKVFADHCQETKHLRRNPLKVEKPCVLLPAETDDYMYNVALSDCKTAIETAGVAWRVKS